MCGRNRLSRNPLPLANPINPLREPGEYNYTLS